MRRRLGILGLSFFLLLFGVTGCWDSREVEQLAIVTIIGWDRITEQGVDKWQVSARIVRPTEMAKSGNDGKKSVGSEILLKGTGETIQTAFRDFKKRLPRKAFFAHNVALVVGKRAAEEKFLELTETSLRYSETRPRTFLFVTQGEAFVDLQAEPEITSQMAEEVRRLARNDSQQMGVSYGVTISELIDWLLSPDRDAVLPQIQVYSPGKGEESVDKTPLVEGLGVIREGKLVGWLNQEESLGYLLIARKTGQAQIPVPVQFGDKVFSYWVTSFKSRIVPQIEGDNISYRVEIKVQGAIFENDRIEVTADTIPQLEEAAGEKLQEIALKTIAKSQAYDADFLGLTEQLHRYKLSAWQKISGNWREGFRDVEVQVEVDANVSNAGKFVRKLDFK